jgi:hypothetical protein
MLYEFNENGYLVGELQDATNYDTSKYTDVTPPATQDEEIAKYDVDAGTWSVVTDYTSKLVYTKETGEPAINTSVELSEEYTVVEPTGDYKYVQFDEQTDSFVSRGEEVVLPNGTTINTNDRAELVKTKEWLTQNLGSTVAFTDNTNNEVTLASKDIAYAVSSMYRTEAEDKLEKALSVYDLEDTGVKEMYADTYSIDVSEVEAHLATNSRMLDTISNSTELLVKRVKELEKPRSVLLWEGNQASTATLMLEADLSAKYDRLEVVIEYLTGSGKVGVVSIPMYCMVNSLEVRTSSADSDKVKVLNDKMLRYETNQNDNAMLAIIGYKK